MPRNLVFFACTIFGAMGCPVSDLPENDISEVDTAIAQICEERTGPVKCTVTEPPKCQAGTFPASDGICWTGRCLDCLKTCEKDDECVVVKACNCGCEWAETVYELAAAATACIVTKDRECIEYCSPEMCSELTCGFCQLNTAICDDGNCVAVEEDCFR